MNRHFHQRARPRISCVDVGTPIQKRMSGFGSDRFKAAMMERCPACEFIFCVDVGISVYESDADFGVTIK